MHVEGAALRSTEKTAMYRPIEVKAIWDSEAKVWVAQSDDVPGLATYGKDIAHLVEKLNVMIPELLEASGEPCTEVPYHLMSELSAIARNVQ